MARLIDADTVRVPGAGSVRLAGLDAPEIGQPATDARAGASMPAARSRRRSLTISPSGSVPAGASGSGAKTGTSIGASSGRSSSNIRTAERKTRAVGWSATGSPWRSMAISAPPTNGGPGRSGRGCGQANSSGPETTGAGAAPAGRRGAALAPGRAGARAGSSGCSPASCDGERSGRRKAADRAARYGALPRARSHSTRARGRAHSGSFPAHSWLIPKGARGRAPARATRHLYTLAGAPPPDVNQIAAPVTGGFSGSEALVGSVTTPRASSHSAAFVSPARALLMTAFTIARASASPSSSITSPTSATRTGFQPISSDFDRRASCKGLV